MKFGDIISKELLFEVKKEKTGSIKVFYDIDIKIKEEDETVAPTAESPQPEVPEVPVAPEVPPVQTVTPIPGAPVQESMNEEEGNDISKKIEGIISLSKEEVENIQIIDDLLDVLGDKKHKGEDLLDDLTVEVITGLIADPNSLKTSNIVKKDDQIVINLAYGFKKDDSVGIKILKRRGVNSISIMMLKDNEVLNAPFDAAKFNSQIVEYRNEVVKK